MQRRGLGPYKFQSTHPIRDATAMQTLLDYQMNISIHAPHTGCDYT